MLFDNERMGRNTPTPVPKGQGSIDPSFFSASNQREMEFLGMGARKEPPLVGEELHQLTVTQSSH